MLRAGIGSRRCRASRRRPSQGSSVLRTEWSRRAPTPEAQGLLACRGAPALQVCIVKLMMSGASSATVLQILPGMAHTLITSSSAHNVTLRQPGARPGVSSIHACTVQMLVSCIAHGRELVESSACWKVTFMILSTGPPLPTNFCLS